MEIGKLNRRITIHSFGANVADGFGGFTKGTETTAETWCSAKGLSMGESLLNGLLIGQANYEFTFRYEKGNEITQQNKITYEGRDFRIRSVLEQDENKRIVKVLASERTN